MLKLVKLEDTHETLLNEMMDEWTLTGEKIIPYVIRKNDYHQFKFYKENLDTRDTYYVLTTTLFLLDESSNCFIGAANIRHELNEALLHNVGHIGLGIRPSKRGNGYGAKLLELALSEAKKLGISRVLLVCNKENTASSSTIKKNGGVLEDVREDRGTLVERYWIDIK